MRQKHGPTRENGAQPITLATLNTRTRPESPPSVSKPSNRSSRSGTSRRPSRREWICYHNPDEMDCPADEADAHSVETGKKTLRPGNMLGDRIWLVGRDEDTAKYYLYGFFIVDSFKDGRAR
jgi:hypothetical protein